MGDRNSIGSGDGGGGGWLGGKGNGADEEMGAFGVNNFAAKQQQVDAYYDNNMTLENLDEVKAMMAKLFREDIPAAAKGTFNSVVKGVTPGFIQRFQNRKIHVQDVEDKERYANFQIFSLVVHLNLTPAYVFFYQEIR